MTLHCATAEAAAVHYRAVVGLIDLDAQDAQAGCHRCYAVAFFHAQFANAREYRFAARRSRCDKQHREFVNGKGYQVRINRPALQPG